MTDIVEQAIGEIIVRDSTGAGVKSATTNFQRMYDVVRYNWWGIQNLGMAFAGLGGAISTGLGAAVKASVDFDQGMQQVRRTANLTTDQTQQMGKALRDLALVKPIKVGVLQEIAADAGALGISGVNNIKTFTGTIADLVSTTNLTESSAVQLARLGGVLNIQGDQWQRLGSAILFAGVSSAATETDIVNMSVRLSGAAAAAHLTASEIVALAATTSSLGSSSQLGATSIQRTIQLMSKAIAQGGDALKTFAHVSGYEGPQAAKQFAAAFQGDAAKAFASFVTGLGKMRGDTVGVNKILLDLGITSQRGAQTLLQLAAGTQQTANKMLNINTALRLTQQAWDQNNELQKQAAQLYGSTANQLKITENVVHDVAIGFGNTLLPALNAILKPIADVLWGFDQLPTGMKEALSIIGLLVGGVALLGGAMLAMAPRVILVMGTLREFVGVMKGLTDTAGLTVAAVRAQAAAESEGATISAFAAGKISAAKRDEAVARYQAWNAAIKEDIQRRTSTAVQTAEAEAIRFNNLAREQQYELTILVEQAEMALAQAEDLAAKGDLEGAAAARERAVALGQAASAAEVAAASAADMAAANEAAAASAEAAGAAALAEAEALAAAEVAETGATGAAFALGAAIDFALGPVGIAIALVSALAIGLGVLGSQHRNAANAAKEEVAANQSLVDALRKSGSAMSDSVIQAELQNKSFITAADAANRFGISIMQLYQIITGLASVQQTTAYFNKLRTEWENGNKAAGEQFNRVRELALEYRASAEAAATTNQAQKSLHTSMDDTTKSAKDQTNALQELKAEHDSINNALLDLPQALMGVKDAEQAVKDAQNNLSDVMAAGAQRAEDLKKAQDDLARAQIDQAKAAQAVKDAEVTLAGARAQEAQNVVDAQMNLQDEQNKLLDQEQKIADLEAKIDAERNGPTMKDITEATNKLADANIKLEDSQKGVQDAQYMLNYLMREGASARDIKDAQDQLAKAQQDVADNTQAVADAQDNLNKVTTGDPAQLAQDQRDLADAQNELVRIQEELAKDTADLQKAQDDLANDTLYKNAQQALTEAQIGLDEANLRVTDSTLKLTQAQKNTGANDEAAAQLRLEEALYGLAEARTRVRKDTALARGEEFGAGREARTLADELGKLGIKASGPVAKDIGKFRSILQGAVSDIHIAKTEAAGFDGLGTPRAVPKIDMGNAGIPDSALPVDKPGQSWIQKFGKFLHDHARDIAAGLLIALGIAVSILSVGIVPLVAGIVSAIVGGIVLIIDHAGEIGDAFKTAFSAVADFFTKTLPGWAETARNATLGMFTGWASDIGGGLADAGGAIAHFFTTDIPNGITSAASAVWNWLKGLPGEFKQWFSSAVSWIGTEMSAGARKVWDFVTKTVPSYLKRIPGYFRNQFSQASGAIGHALTGAANTVLRLVSKTIPGFIKNLPHEFDVYGKQAVDHLVNAFANLANRVGGRLAGFGEMFARVFKGPINIVIGLIDAFFDKIATLHIHIPKIKIPFAPDFPGFDFGFPHWHINPLAAGGILTGPTISGNGGFLAGEAGPEAVIPLDRLMAMFEPVSTMALQMNSLTESLHTLVSTLGTGAHGAVGGDTFNIDGAHHDPLDIAREVVWQKKIRMR